MDSNNCNRQDGKSAPLLLSIRSQALHMELFTWNGAWHSVNKGFVANEEPHNPTTWSMGAHLHALADLI
jgi:hypothetical protein